MLVFGGKRIHTYLWFEEKENKPQMLEVVTMVSFISQLISCPFTGRRCKNRAVFYILLRGWIGPWTFPLWQPFLTPCLAVIQLLWAFPPLQCIFPWTHPRSLLSPTVHSATPSSFPCSSGINFPVSSSSQYSFSASSIEAPISRLLCLPAYYPSLHPCSVELFFIHH